tara:strand:- start:198 stop:527 length:330 start_codon:yes stop_codon:yes gene_type:complete
MSETNKEINMKDQIKKDIALLIEKNYISKGAHEKIDEIYTDLNKLYVKHGVLASIAAAMHVTSTLSNYDCDGVEIKEPSIDASVSRLIWGCLEGDECNVHDEIEAACEN